MVNRTTVSAFVRSHLPGRSPGPFVASHPAGFAGCPTTS